MRATVVFYFDFLSPYSYIAFKLLQGLKGPWGLAVEYRPVRLPHIIKATNNSPPAAVPARKAFLNKDIRRTCAMHGIPFAPAPDFMMTPTKGAGLVITAANGLVRAGRLKETEVEELIADIWRESFAKGNTAAFTEDPIDLLQVIESLASTKDAARELVELAGREETSKELYATTDEALAKGAYGMPTILVTKGDEVEFFFGGDRFHHIAEFLGIDPRTFFDHTTPLRRSKI